ncbi:MAG: glycosyltransferase [Acidobacteria bacterium]|jgi:cellulose synthase/poly-beta-1,6-N-acetylglucosamine synthase-like glycosyltransferase/peptidoglycan/xylan/chitin deacetylase (PgdA/CDA1 family)/spore germination protein YaaH|nr:glycosyltransferase [Acidobacteriota bacterium]
MSPQDKGHPQRPVFHDPERRRWRRVRAGLLALGAFLSICFGVAVFSVMINPSLLSPALDGRRATLRQRLAPPVHKPWIMDRRERRLFRTQYQLYKAKAAQAQKKLAARAASNGQSHPLLLGFYVNWDDTSLTSLKANINKMDGLVAEWLHLGGKDGSLIEDAPDRTRLALDFIHANRPDLKIFALANNFNTASFSWNGELLTGLLADKRARAKAISGMVDFAAARRLAGLCVDFEGSPNMSQRALRTFMEELGAAARAQNLQVAECVPMDDPGFDYAGLSKACDYLILMAYDQHWSSGEAGPLAAQDWFASLVRERTKQISSDKLIIALGNYGYDWVDGKKGANALSYQEAVTTASESDGQIVMDAGALNPTYDYYDDDNALHHVWFLDATTSFNEMNDSSDLGPAGYALWRLGSEDPSFWALSGKEDDLDAGVAQSLRVLHYGYDLDYEGKGEILRVKATPKDGLREIKFDDDSGLITAAKLVSFPSPYVILRSGGKDPMKIALTFDDGPDGKYTAPILDILKRYGVHGTFFIVGSNAEQHQALLKRLVNEGNEIGDHTFSHPNIAEISDKQLTLELNATQRLLESRLGRQTILFRPPYGEDVEPTTPAEVKPLLVSSSLGYVTVGMLIDPGDWYHPGVDVIVRRVLEGAELHKGNVVLLHDGGGDRSQTVKALPLLIEGLEARGFKLVGVSELMGLSRDEVMPKVPPSERLITGIDDLFFILLGVFIWSLSLLFVLGIVLGIARLCFIGLLAVVEKFQRKPVAPPDFSPPVSVIVPCYNEEKVIAATVEALLVSDYPAFEVIVVDDGSSDSTYQTALEKFGGEKLVRVFTKRNEGKAAALNFGITQANGEIIVALDADTIFEPSTLRELVAPFADGNVSAVAGNAKVGNRVNLHTWYQALEYITGQNLDRRAFGALNCITVVPGAVGAWRKNLVIGAGGFSSDTLAEDADLTLSLLEKGTRVLFAERARGWTEAPDTVKGFMRQRFRWMYGTMQAAWKHRKAFLNPRYGSMGMFALPNILVFQVLFPLVSPVMDLVMATSVFMAVMQQHYHPADDPSHALSRVLFYYAMFLVVDVLASVLAFSLERDEDWWLMVWLPVQRFLYRQLMYYVAIKSVMTAVRGGVVGWGKLERKATATAPKGGDATA